MNIRCPPNTLQIFSECLMQTKAFQTHCMSQFQIYKVTSLQFRMLVLGLIIYNVSNMGQIQNTFFIKSQLMSQMLETFSIKSQLEYFSKMGTLFIKSQLKYVSIMELSSSNLSLSMDLSSLNLSLICLKPWNFLHKISA